MKRILAVLFALCVLLSCACGNAPASGKTEAAPDPALTAEVVSESEDSAADAAETEAAPAEPSAAPESVDPEPVGEEEKEELVDGQNPVMNFVGPYVCSGCNVFIEADGARGAKASITWSFGAGMLSEWSFSGKFDPDTLSFNYSDGIKKNYTYGDDGFITNTETVYESGTGNIAFTGEGMLYWTDEVEHIADGMMFAFSGGMMEQWGVS